MGKILMKKKQWKKLAKKYRRQRNLFFGPAGVYLQRMRKNGFTFYKGTYFDLVQKELEAVEKEEDRFGG